ncbi:hypothetical protein Vadar_025499 [Vaccinium darrowii]|uniref:Uncharacterized protein n=1 Tax=Vaccinium darrowii TaxID=229202 RepID=A0ACB7YYX0_9ERIC|nr:hypothetical protein Vadar_025499 [Vaccinium darrowii]
MDGPLRQGEERIPHYVNRAFLTFNVHHGGIFIHDRGSKCYVGGQVSYSDYEDKNKVSLLDLDEIGKKVWFTEAVEFYYKVPCTGVFKIIENDNDILDMVKCIKDRKLDIFLVIPNSSIDDLEDINAGNWEWDSGTVPKSGITIEDGNMHIVNEPMQSCSCRRWDLTGIPCEHGAMVIVENGGQPEDYVSLQSNHQNTRSKLDGLENQEEGKQMNSVM